jgi:hypothetical protein
VGGKKLSRSKQAFGLVGLLRILQILTIEIDSPQQGQSRETRSPRDAPFGCFALIKSSRSPG